MYRIQINDSCKIMVHHSQQKQVVSTNILKQKDNAKAGRKEVPFVLIDNVEIKISNNRVNVSSCQSKYLNSYTKVFILIYYVSMLNLLQGAKSKKHV